MLERVIERCHDVRGLDGPPIVAFSTHVPDACDVLCRNAGADVHRGPENDVLYRYWTCMVAYDLDAVLRVTADCPLISPDLNTLLVHHYRREPCDYYGPRPGHLEGLIQEIVSRDAIAAANVHSEDSADREHVIPYIVDRPDEFTVRYFDQHTFSVDTPAGLEAVRPVFA